MSVAMAPQRGWRYLMLPLDPAKFVPLSDVPAMLPARPNGRKVHISAVYRWASKGVKGVRLETVRIAGALFTTREAVEDFINAAAQPVEVRVVPDRLAERRQAIAAARLAVELGLLETSGKRNSPRVPDHTRAKNPTSIPNVAPPRREGGA